LATWPPRPPRGASAYRPGRDRAVHVRLPGRDRLGTGQPARLERHHEGKAYEDKGEVVTVEPEHRLEVTHFSPLTGQEDVPANYQTLGYELEQRDGTTRVALSQDNNSSEEAAEHSKANWEKMLAGLKEVAEP
jgi:uncharacterized protein YndB with AHSA1/START domain